MIVGVAEYNVAECTRDRTKHGTGHNVRYNVSLQVVPIVYMIVLIFLFYRVVVSALWHRLLGSHVLTA